MIGMVTKKIPYGIWNTFIFPVIYNLLFSEIYSFAFKSKNTYLWAHKLSIPFIVQWRPQVMSHFGLGFGVWAYANGEEIILIDKEFGMSPKKISYFLGIPRPYSTINCLNSSEIEDSISLVFGIMPCLLTVFPFFVNIFVNYRQVVKVFLIFGPQTSVKVRREENSALFSSTAKNIIEPSYRRQHGSAKTQLGENHN